MENKMEGDSDTELLDPFKHSMAEVSSRVDAYKRRLEENDVRLKMASLSLQSSFCALSFDMIGIRQDIEKLELQREQHQQLQRELMARLEPDTIEESTAENGSPKVEINHCQATEGKDEIVFIRFGPSKCPYQNCRRQVDSQLLLLHYLFDHEQENSGVQQCHRLIEGQRTVLSFPAMNYPVGVNQVLGLLAYCGTVEQQFDQQKSPMRRKVYNSFLPQQHVHLESDIPVVVLICRTKPSAMLSEKLQARQSHLLVQHTDHIFVIWLVTPNIRRKLNATLYLCGRDAAVMGSSVVRVRGVNRSQETHRFMPVDSNYWRLTYAEMQKLSNGFRDELHLEIGLTEAPPT
ncbi:uncharacterized protein LOC108160072 [Drosophila miranda]|uniref:uncharacterized protein LOC108160072 n=1 Tax=Drosophila miranda TaxID=7229 RepID=UPI0007E63207|nr:uncharacterized protein LOC108160072 [Drosophila miranda]